MNVVNHTHSTCRLVHLDDPYSTLVTSTVKQELAPLEELHLEAWQGYYAGPSLTLGLVCGTSFLMFQSSQGMCLFLGTSVKPQIIDQDKDISLQVLTTEDSSLLENLPGKVSWAIEEIRGAPSGTK